MGPWAPDFNNGALGPRFFGGPWAPDSEKKNSRLRREFFFFGKFNKIRFWGAPGPPKILKITPIINLWGPGAPHGALGPLGTKKIPKKKKLCYDVFWS
jgi:hypothetical protein